MVWGRDYVPANLKKKVLASSLGYVKQRLGSKKDVLLVILVGMRLGSKKGVLLVILVGMGLLC